MPNYLPNAEPFHFPGNRVGCLLIHGFTGTPYEMRGLGERLAQQGYTVLAHALAGHATQARDLIPTRWRDWYASATAGYDQLSASCDAIFPIGLSMGGALALHLAAHRAVNGVVAISTPFTIHSPLKTWFKFFPFLFDLFPAIQKNRARGDTEDRSILENHPNYAEYPTRASASLIAEFLPHLHSDLRDVCAPALLIKARNDRTVPANSMEEFHARIGSREKEMVWLPRGGHLALEDFSKEKAFAHILRFVDEHRAAEPAKPVGRNYADVNAEFLR